MSLAAKVKKTVAKTIRNLGRPGLLRRRLPVADSETPWRPGTPQFEYYPVSFVPDKQQIRDEHGTLTGQYMSLLHISADGVVPQKNDQVSAATSEQEFTNYWEISGVMPVELSATTVLYTVQVNR